MTQVTHHDDEELDTEAFKAMIRNSVHEGENNLHRSQDFVGSQTLSPRSSHRSPRKPKGMALYEERPSGWLGSPSKRKSYRVKSVATNFSAPDLDDSSRNFPEAASEDSTGKASPEKESKEAAPGPKQLDVEEETLTLQNEPATKESEPSQESTAEPASRRRYVAVEAQPVKTKAKPLKAKHSTASMTHQSLGASSSHHDSSNSIHFNSEHSLADVEYYKRVIRECNQIDMSPLQRSQEFLGGSQHSFNNDSFHTAREHHGFSPYASSEHRPSDWMGSPASAKRRTYKIKAIPNLDEDVDTPSSSKAPKARPPTGMTKHSLGASSSHHKSGFVVDSGNDCNETSLGQESLHRPGLSSSTPKSNTEGGCLRRPRHSSISSERPTDWVGSPSTTMSRSYIIKTTNKTTNAEDSMPDLERITITSQPSNSSKCSTLSDMEFYGSDTKILTKPRVSEGITRHTPGASVSLHENSSFGNSSHSTTSNMPDPEKYKKMIRDSTHSQRCNQDLSGASDHSLYSNRSLNHESFHSARDFFDKSSHNPSAGRPLEFLGSPPSVRKRSTTIKKIPAAISPVPKLDADDLTDDSDHVEDSEAELTPGRRARNGRSQSMSLSARAPNSARRAPIMAKTQPVKSQSMAAGTEAPYVSPVQQHERVNRNKFMAALSAFEVSK